MNQRPQETYGGKGASSFVDDGDNIILDSGSTVTGLASNLQGSKDQNIVTKAINIALMLGAENSDQVLLVGGQLKLPTLSLTGDLGIGMLEGIHFDKLFLAACGLSLKAGLTFPSLSDLEIKRRMIEGRDCLSPGWLIQNREDSVRFPLSPAMSIS